MVIGESAWQRLQRLGIATYLWSYYPGWFLSGGPFYARTLGSGHARLMRGCCADDARLMRGCCADDARLLRN